MTPPSGARTAVPRRTERRNARRGKQTRAATDAAPPAPVAGAQSRAALAPFDLAALGVAFLLIAILAFRRVWAVDYGYQLAVGRWIAAHGIPHVDALSWGGAGRPWIELRWLYCLVLHWVSDGPGVAWVTPLVTAAILVAFALATATAWGRARAALAALVLPIAAMAASERFTARPELVSDVMFAAFLLVLYRDARKPTRWLWALPALQVVWANAHTVSVLGPVLVVIALVARAWTRLRARPGERGPAAISLRRGALVALAVAIAALVTPYGMQVIPFTLHLYREMQGGVAEQVITELRGSLQVENARLVRPAFVALALIGATALISGWRRLDAFLALTWAAMLALTVMAVRNQALFALVSVPLVLAHAGDAFPRRRAWGARLGAAALVAMMLVSATLGWAAVTDRLFVWQGNTNQWGTGLARHRFSEGTARWLAARRDLGRVFATFRESSWLLTEGIAGYIDPRIEVFGEWHLERFVAAWQDPRALEGLTRQEQIGVVVAGLHDTRFLQKLLANPRWQLAAFDEAAAVFVRADSTQAVDPAAARASEDSCAAALRARFEQPPAHPGWFARVASAQPVQRTGAFLVGIGRGDLARPFLRDALVLDPTAIETRLQYATALVTTGDSTAARAEREEASRRAPRDARPLVAQALEDLMSGRAAEARARLEPFLAREGGSDLAWATLAEARVALGDTSGAIEAFDAAVRLAPAKPFYQSRRTELSEARGR